MVHLLLRNCCCLEDQECAQRSYNDGSSNSFDKSGDKKPSVDTGQASSVYHPHCHYALGIIGIGCISGIAPPAAEVHFC